MARSLAAGKLDCAEFQRTPERATKARDVGRAGPCNCSPIYPKRIWPARFSYYYGDNNYDAALKEFEIARNGLPNESEVYASIGAIQRRQGKWAESTANLEKGGQF